MSPVESVVKRTGNNDICISGAGLDDMSFAFVGF